ncbi:MAG: asparaginase domain-containing protein [Candidatus Dormibacteraceae bacterium]
MHVATRPEAAALGPLVVLQDEIHLARNVTKSHSVQVAAFSSPGRGPIGAVLEDRVTLFASTAPSDMLGLPARVARRVDLVWAAAGADGAQLAAVRDAEGVVVAGTGGGHLPGTMLPALQGVLDAGVPVVLASRAGAGPVLRGTYGVVGIGVRSARSRRALGRGATPREGAS